MNKSGNSPKSDSNNKAKKTPTNFIRKEVKFESNSKTPIFESQLKKENNWLKKTNDSWDY